MIRMTTMTTITKSVITMSQRARLHDRIYPPRNVGTGSPPALSRVGADQVVLPRRPAVAHDHAAEQHAPSMRTLGSEVARGRWGKSAGRLKSLGAAGGP